MRESLSLQIHESRMQESLASMLWPGLGCARFKSSDLSESLFYTRFRCMHLRGKLASNRAVIGFLVGAAVQLRNKVVLLSCGGFGVELPVLLA